jgi:hypothetical protein
MALRVSDSPPARTAAHAAGVTIGVGLAAVAALRRGKPVHPHGAVYAASLHVLGAPAAPSAAELLATPGEHAAIVRFSRSIGLPRPLPDLLGMSIRVLHAYGSGRHQDFLLVTSVDLPVLHHVFVPAGDVQQRPYSSSLPYCAGGETFLIGTLPRAASPRPTGSDEMNRLRRAAATGRLAFDLAVAPLRGRFRTVAGLHIGAALPRDADALRFSPFNSGGGLCATGLLNRMRKPAYTLSQAAWRTTRPDGAGAQDAADRLTDASSALR